MLRQIEIFPDTNDEHEKGSSFSSMAKEQHAQFRYAQVSILQNALDKWWDIYYEVRMDDDSETVSLVNNRGGRQPVCYWPEVVQKMWQLKGNLDHAINLCLTEEAQKSSSDNEKKP